MILSDFLSRQTHNMSDPHKLCPYLQYVTKHSKKIIVRMI